MIAGCVTSWGTYEDSCGLNKHKMSLRGVLEFGLALLAGFLGLASSATVSKGGIVSESQGTLVFSHIVCRLFREVLKRFPTTLLDSIWQLYRHGDRTPAAFYPKDPYNHTYDWPVGLGELSNTGKNQHYKFGQWLRSRYDEDFLPKAYSEQNIYVRSTNVGRTIASALSNLAGMFPPAGEQVWNKAIAWQPIPVHNVPAEYDWLLGVHLPSCPVYEKEYDRVMASPVVQKLLADYHTQIDYSLKNAGNNLNTSSSELLMDVLLIRDSLYVETLYHKT